MDTFISNILRMTLIQTVLYTKEQIIAVTWVSLDKSSITLSTVWQTEQLTATVSPNNATNKNVNWSSSNTSIATVSNTWLVTCVTPWSATITVTTVDGWFTDTCSVAQWWWTPWANTYLYRPLVSDANDTSGNNRNWTINGSLTWNNWAVFNANAQISTWLSIMPSNFTISIWVNKASAGSEDTLFARWGGWDRYRFWMYFNSSKNLYVYQCTAYNDGRWVLVGNYGYGTWKNVVFTRSSGNEIKVYVDGSYVVNADYAYWTDGTWYLGIWWWTDSQGNFHWTLKDFIIENVVWSASDVSNYYNQTKWDYWIS